MSATGRFESSLLGACLLDGANVPLLNEALPLLSRSGKITANALLELVTNGAPPDLTLLRDQIGEEDWDRIGGHAYFTHLITGSSRSANASHYLDGLKRVAGKATALSALQSASKALQENESPGVVADLLDSARAALTPPDAPSMTPLDLAKILDAPTIDPPWLVKDWLAEGDRLIVGGQPSFGKSYILLDLALALASGRTFLGMPVSRPVRVTIVDEENPQVQDERRLQTLLRGRGLSLDEVKQLPLRVFTGQNLRDPAAAWGRLQDEITQHPCDVLLFDSLVRFIGGKDENDNSAISEWFNEFIDPLVRDYALTVAILHHIRKPPQNRFAQEGDPMFALRGAGDIAGWADCIWSGSMDGSARTLEVSKSRWLIGIKPTLNIHLEQDKATGGAKLLASEPNLTAEDMIGGKLAMAGPAGLLRSFLVEEYAAETGLSTDSAGKAISRAARKLLGGGILTETKEGRATRYVLAEYKRN